MAGGDRSRADELLAGHLAAGLTVAAAAEQARVSERTAHRRLEESAFKSRVAELRGEMISQSLGRLSAAMTAAADKLAGLLESESEGIRLRAAVALLEVGLKVREQVELSERVRQLEEALEARKP